MNLSAVLIVAIVALWLVPAIQFETNSRSLPIAIACLCAVAAISLWSVSSAVAASRGREFAKRAGMWFATLPLVQIGLIAVGIAVNFILFNSRALYSAATMLIFGTVAGYIAIPIGVVAAVAVSWRRGPNVISDALTGMLWYVAFVVLSMNVALR